MLITQNIRRPLSVVAPPAMPVDDWSPHSAYHRQYRRSNDEVKSLKRYGVFFPHEIVLNEPAHL